MVLLWNPMLKVMLQQHYKKHKNFKAFDTGMTFDFENLFLSVCPDLETSCDHCICNRIEINSPYSICEAKPTVENLNYLHEVNGSVKLKLNHQCYTQIQGQMTITNRLTAWFFVYNQHGNYLEKVQFDPPY